MSGTVKTASAVMVLGMVVLAMSACDNGPSAVQTRDRAGGPDAVLTAASLGGSAEGGEGAAAVPAGDQVVTANRRETASVKITRLYERNGAAFGARSAEDYADRMKAFLDSPPADADTARRPNGDTLYYQPSTNTFAVVSRDGTPRTMFKPDDGPTYWAQQKARAPEFGLRKSAPAE